MSVWEDCRKIDCNNTIAEAMKVCLFLDKYPLSVAEIKRYLCVRGIIQDDVHVLTLNAILQNDPEFSVVHDPEKMFPCKMWRLQ